MTDNFKLYTQQELDIELLKNANKEFYRSIKRIDKFLDKIESNQKWILGLMGTGFAGLLILMAHGFNWII